MNGTNCLVSNDIEKEKRIINDIVLSSKEEFSGVLEEFIDIIKTCSISEVAEIKNQLFSDICEHFLKILYRINRFSEFKSKTRILLKGDKVSNKELERCDFIIRLADPNTVTILKNIYTETKGSFKTVKKAKKE